MEKLSWIKVGRKVKVKIFANINDYDISSNRRVNFTQKMFNDFRGHVFTISHVGSYFVKFEELGISWAFDLTWIEPVNIKIKLKDLV